MSSFRDTPHDPAHVLSSPLEVLAILRTLARRNTLLQLSAETGSASIVTTLLHIDAGAKRLIFDAAPDPALTRRLMAAPELLFSTSLDKIQVSFRTATASPVVFENRPALATPMPDTLVRLQRRENFRISTPVQTPVLCRIPTEQALLELPLEDISSGGLALYDDTQALTHTPGVHYTGCAIALPDLGVAHTTLCIAHAQTLQQPNGKTRYRIGCSYVDPDATALHLIQRYISRLEREASARQRGFR